MTERWNLGLLLVLLGVFCASAAPSEEPRNGISTLYARDALSQTLCFADGKFGKIVQEGEVRNRCSDIDFDGYLAGSFSSGIEGARVAAFLDLGTEADLATKYGFEETVGRGEGFASIAVKRKKFYISKNRREKTLQELSNADVLFAHMRSGANVPIRVGHIYLLHISDEYQQETDFFVKLLVVSYAPGDSVTIRWQLF